MNTAEIMIRRWGNDFVQGSQWSMTRPLNRFQEVLASTYDEAGRKFIRQNGSLPFLCFLKPIIIRTGFFRAEPGMCSRSRKDVVISH